MSDLVAEAPEGTGFGGTRALESCVNVFNDVTAEDFDPMSFAIDGVDWSPTNPMDSNRFGDAVQAADVGGGYPATGIKADLGESDNQDDAFDRAAEE